MSRKKISDDKWELIREYNNRYTIEELIHKIVRMHIEGCDTL